jgi:hypothetical protein
MAIAVVFVVGLAVAIAKPGNLGGSSSEQAAPPTTTSTTSTTAVTPTTAATSTTTLALTPPTTPTTSAPTSGLAATGAGSVGRRGLATTGGSPWALPGGILLAAALATRRLAARG